MDEKQLDKIQARCEAATPEPWEPGSQDRYTRRFSLYQSAEARKSNPLGWQRACICREARMMDAIFMAHARTDVPALLTEVRRLRAALALYADKRNWQVWPQYCYDATAFVSWCPEVDGHDNEPWVIAQEALA